MHNRRSIPVQSKPARPFESNSQSPLHSPEAVETPQPDTLSPSQQLSPAFILGLQRSHGNQFVQRFLSQHAPTTAIQRGGPTVKDAKKWLKDHDIESREDAENVIHNRSDGWETAHIMWNAAHPNDQISIKRRKSLVEGFLTGGETEREGGLLGLDSSGEEPMVIDRSEQTDMLENVTTQFREAQMDHPNVMSAKTLVNKGNYATAMIEISGETDGHEMVFSRDVLLDRDINIFSSGSGRPTNSKVAPAVYSVTKNPQPLKLLKKARLQDSKQSKELLKRFHKRNVKVITADPKTLNAEFMKASGHGMNRMRTGKQQAKATAMGHKHSEQAVKLAIQAKDAEIAEWIRRLNCRSIIHMTIRIFSEREMCNNCSTACNYLMSHIASELPQTWKALNDRKLMYFPTMDVDSRLEFKSNRNVPLSRSGDEEDGPPMAMDIEDEVVPVIGGAKWTDVDQREKMRSQVVTHPPSKRDPQKMGPLSEMGLSQWLDPEQVNTFQEYPLTPAQVQTLQLLELESTGTVPDGNCVYQGSIESGDLPIDVQAFKKLAKKWAMTKKAYIIDKYLGGDASQFKNLLEGLEEWGAFHGEVGFVGTMAVATILFENAGFTLNIINPDGTVAEIGKKGGTPLYLIHVLTGPHPHFYGTREL